MRFLALAILLLATPVIAQPQPPTTAADRVAASLGQCIGFLEKRNDEVADLQRQLSQAQARVKELEEKGNAK